MKLERDAFYAMLGIAMRAGQLSLGESGVLKTVSSGTALFMILDADASDNTKKKFQSVRRRFIKRNFIKRAGIPEFLFCIVRCVCIQNHE